MKTLPNRLTATLLVAASCALALPMSLPAAIVSISETGTDAGRFSIIEPAGSPNGTVFQEDAWIFTDRTHEYNGPAFDGAGNLSTGGATVLGLPDYLVGHPYVANANNHRDNANYTLTVTVDTISRIYLLIDNRVGDGANATPPTLGSGGVGLMAWVADMGFAQVNTGISPNGQPDFVGADEGAQLTASDPAARTHLATVGAGVGLNQFFTVYAKTISAGSITLRQQAAGSLNMYGVVVAPFVPTQPPATPANLQVTSGDGSVSLSWSPGPGADSFVDAYIVKRSLVSGGPYEILATNVTTAYLDTAVVNGQTYYYVLSAFNAAGESPNSNQAIARPDSAPTGLVAIGGTNQVLVSWNAFSGASSYTVKRSSVSGGPYTSVATGIAGTSHLDTGVQSGRTFYYVVVAQLTAGGESGQSAEVAADTAPGAPTLTASLLAATVIRLAWTSDPVVTSFTIEQSNDGQNFAELATVPGGAQVFLATGLVASQTYTHRVRAMNGSGLSPFSAPASAATPSFGVNINFAAASFATNFPGYVNDYGDVFADRGNGFSYGWDVDNVGNSRERNLPNSPDKRYDTLNHMSRAARVWEVAVPNGFYLVHLVSGDPGFTDSTFHTSVEGVLTPVYIPTAVNNGFWADFTLTTAVSDERLTLTDGPAFANNKICFIDIYSTVPEPPVLGAQPQSVTAEEFHAASMSVGTSAGSTPFAFQWYQNGNPVPGGTGATLTFPNVRATDAGAYTVVVTNYGGAVTSTVATLTVYPDTNAPTVLSAACLDGINIFICFSEELDNSNLAVTDYLFTYTINGGTVGATNAIFRPDRRSVVLQASTPITGPFTVQVGSDVFDLATNAVADGTIVGDVVAGYAAADIGAPGMPGSHFTCDGSSIEIVGGGADVWGNADQFHFLSTSFSGDFDARVRVTELRGANTITKAVLAAREDTAPGARSLHISVNPTPPGRNQIELGLRAATGGATAGWGASFVPAGIPNVWLRITRVGDTFTGYRSSNGVDWIAMGTNVQVFPAAMTVGIGVTAHDNALLATGVFSNFQVSRFIAEPTLMGLVYAGGTFSASFQSQNGISYDIQYKNDLGASQWTTLTTLAGNGAVLSFTDPGPVSPTRMRVYRAQAH
jgi:fibronectin type 3 domain-containing protein